MAIIGKRNYAHGPLLRIENHGMPPAVPLVRDPKGGAAVTTYSLRRRSPCRLDDLKRIPLSTPQVPPFPDYWRYRC
jgi:hypothetical protein